MPTLFQIRTFIKYWLDAVDRHSLHSPFFYDLYTTVIKQKIEREHFQRIENLRQQLIQDTKVISVEDLGAGSVHTPTVKREIGTMAATSLTPQKFNVLYQRIIEHFQAKKIIELGTSFGINTVYMAANKDVSITTFEGSKEIAEIARLTFELAEAKNITLIEGNISNTLPSFLQRSGKLDVIFIDANHRYQATKTYFELIIQKTHSKSILIVDDIHYSPEMEQAWKEICNHTLVYGTADLYRCGLVFFDPSLNKQHVVLQF